MFSYNRLWKLLIDKNMKRSELRRLTGLSSNTMSNLGKNQTVSMDALGRICEALGCDVGEIVEYIPNSPAGREDVNE